MSDAFDAGEVFLAIAQWGIDRGVSSISELPGCWEASVGEWKWALNGHREPTLSTLSEDPVPPFTALVMHGDWPAGVVSMTSGVFAGDVEAFLTVLR